MSSDPRQVRPAHESVAAESCGHSWRDWRDPDCAVARAIRICFVVVVLVLVVGLVVWFT